MGRQHWLQSFLLYRSALAELSYCSLLTSTPPSLALAPNHPAQGRVPRSSWDSPLYLGCPFLVGVDQSYIATLHEDPEPSSCLSN